MSKVAITGNASGAGVFTIASPDSATDRTLTLPDETGTVVTTASLNPLTSGTAVASTSGTAIDFTGIPSWAKRITVMLNGVSTTGTINLLVQIGTSGGIETTGYLSYFGYVNTASNVGTGTATTGFGLWHGGSADTHYLPIVLQQVTGNTWLQSHAGAFWPGSSTHIQTGGGNKTLAGTLDRIRLTAVNGTDTFDAGSINIMYE